MSFAPVVDAGGLAALRSAAARGDEAALEEAAVRFEALFIGMLLKSARSASLGEGLLDGGDTQQYLEMMDGQVALDVARRGGFGFGRLLVEQLGGASPPAKIVSDTIFRDARMGSEPIFLERPARAAASPGKMGSDPIFGGPASDLPIDARERFVQALVPHAQRAADRLGVDPKLLVAQAALETGWGASIPRLADGRSTNNLFGVKAGSTWEGPKAGTWTLEVVDGVPERRRAEFRAYDGIAESFADYANVIEGLSRYADARRSAADPEAYARAVVEAGYATDPDYAEKWLAVYRSAPIANAVTDVTRPPQERAHPSDNVRVTAAAHDLRPADAAEAALQRSPSRLVGLTAWME